MASVNETVRYLIERSPCGHHNRSEALHQILAVLGSGYEWRGGEVVYWSSTTESCASRHQRFKYSDEDLAEYRELGIKVKEQFITGRCPDEDLRAQASELAVTPGVLRDGAYGPCPDLLFLTVPENAAPDWEQACVEIAAVVGPLWADDDEDRRAYEMLLRPHWGASMSAGQRRVMERLVAAFEAAAL